MSLVQNINTAPHQVVGALAFNNTVARSSAQRFTDTVSVKEFGAVGDGVTDDTSALQLALDSGKSLYFPDGVYITSRTLNITSTRSLSLRGNSFGHVYDAGKGTVIKHTAEDSAVFRVQGGAIGVSITGLYLDLAHTSGIGFDLGGAWYVKLENCVVRGARFGVHLHYDAPDYFSGVTEISSCYFAKCGAGVKTTQVDINVIQINHCTFFDGTNGVLFGESGNSSSIRNGIVRDCLFEANTSYDVGVVSGGAQQLLIDGNYFEENTASAAARVYVADSSLSPRSTAVTITNNVFSKDTTGDLIFLVAISGVLVKQNWSAFGGVGFVRAIGITDYEIDRCSTISGAAKCPVVIDNVAYAPDTILSKSSLNMQPQFSLIGTTTAVRSTACTRAMIQFEGVNANVSYAAGATVVKTGVGRYTVTLVNTLPSSAYSVNASVGRSLGGASMVVNVVSTSPTQYQLETVDLTGAYQDAGYVSSSVVF